MTEEECHKFHCNQIKGIIGKYWVEDSIILIKNALISNKKKF